MVIEFLLLGLISDNVRGYYSGKGKSGGGKFNGANMGSKEAADEYSKLRDQAKAGDQDAAKKMQSMMDEAKKKEAEKKNALDSMNASVRAQYKTALENGNTEAARQILQQQAKAKEITESMKGRSVQIDISPKSIEDAARQRINKLSFGLDMQQQGVGSYLDGYKKEHPLNARILEVLPPKRNRVKVDKKLQDDFYQKARGQKRDANSIRVLAAMTPAEVLHHSGATNLAIEFSKHAKRSGNYWQDSRTGASFNLGDALKRELVEHDIARELLKLNVHETPGKSPAGQPNIWGIN